MKTRQLARTRMDLAPKSMCGHTHAAIWAEHRAASERDADHQARKYVAGTQWTTTLALPWRHRRAETAVSTDAMCSTGAGAALLLLRNPAFRPSSSWIPVRAGSSCYTTLKCRAHTPGFAWPRSAPPCPFRAPWTCSYTGCKNHPFPSGLRDLLYSF